VVDNYPNTEKRVKKHKTFEGQIPFLEKLDFKTTDTKTGEYFISSGIRRK
jgi:hypothetical protein